MITRTEFSALSGMNRPEPRTGDLTPDSGHRSEDRVVFSEGASRMTLGKVLKAIAAIPVAISETTAGVSVGTASAAIHALPGTAEGFAQGAMGARDDFVDTGIYTTTLCAEFMAGGAALGVFAATTTSAAMAGLLGAALGLLAGGLFRGIQGKADFPKEFCRVIDEAVSSALADNQSSSKVQRAAQDVTEGTIIGGALGVKQGWTGGYEAGKGMVSGIKDVAEGIVEGIEEAIKFKDEE